MQGSLFWHKVEDCGKVAILAFIVGGLRGISVVFEFGFHNVYKQKKLLRANINRPQEFIVLSVTFQIQEGSPGIR